MNNKEDLLDKMFGTANPPEGKTYDFTAVRTWVSRSGKGFGVDWSAKGIGFGQVTFEVGPEGQLHIDTEYMSDLFLTELLAYLVTKSTKDQQPKNWKTTSEYWQEGYYSQTDKCPYSEADAIQYWTQGYEIKKAQGDQDD